MNWLKLKELYPFCHDELKTLSDQTGHDGTFLLDEYFISKGKELYSLRINILKNIESELCNLKK